MIKIIVLLLIGILTACGSAPAPRLPQAIEQIQAENKDVQHALRSGELLRAQHDFEKILLLQQSLDDTAESAITIINLAAVAHQLHDDAGALVWLDKLLLEKEIIYPAESQQSAAFRKAVILTNLSRLSEAEAVLLSAEKLCEKKCAIHFNIDGLRARLLLLKGDAQGALTLAQAVSKEFEAGKEEQANALRISAAAEEILTRYTDALQHYRNTLEMDKMLGLGVRIGEDLSGMARVAKLLGRDQEAETYSRRAKLVNDSLRQSATP